MRFVKLSFLVVAACLVVGCGGGSEDGAGPIGPGPIPSILADVGQEQGTTVGEILANPAQFVGQRVQLSGAATAEIGPRGFLCTDNTGEIPLPACDIPSRSSRRGALRNVLCQGVLAGYSRAWLSGGRYLQNPRRTGGGSDRDLEVRRPVRLRA